MKEKKVLIVDNDDFSRKLYKNKLEKEERVKVLESKNGSEAYDIASKEMPDLIVTEITMQGGSGFSLLKKIKEDKNLQDIPVIILTKLAQENDKKQGIELGAEDYLIKSENIFLEVIEKIKKILDIEEKNN